VIKINISFSKKVPGAAEYSSDGFLCALEMEASDSALNNPAELRQKMAWLWNEAKQSVEQQIAQSGNGRQPIPAAPTATPARAAEPTVQNGDEPATTKQTKYIISLAQREHSMKLADLAAFLKRTVGREDVHKLTKAEASKAIEALVGKGDVK
jgi:hypothetical protein